MKKLANDNMHRVLTAKAFDVFSSTDPIDVYEEDGIFSTRGCIEADGLTAEQLNELFEDLAAGEEEE